MRSELFRTVLVLLVSQTASTAGMSEGVVLRVDASSPGDVEDGQSWCTAFRRLQDALSFARFASVPVTIYVAGGTYYADEGQLEVEDDPRSTFRVPAGVVLRGGFAGCGEKDPDARDPSIDVTTLSGDLLQDDAPSWMNRADNAYHVVTFEDAGEATLMEGVDVTGGNSGNGAGAGAGVLCVSSSPTIRECRIYGNRSYFGGGGVSGCDGLIESCEIELNHASSEGGGLHDCDGHVLNTMIRSNTAYVGAGLAACDGLIQGCEVVENTANASGGGIASCSADIQRTLIARNEAFSSGGGLHECTGSIDSCRIIDNVVEHRGGGVGESGATISNSIIAGNTAQFGGGGFAGFSGTAVNCTIVGNRSLLPSLGGAVYVSTGALTNCIIWYNSEPFWDDSFPYPSFSCHPELESEPGGVTDPPEFFTNGYRTTDGRWIDGDYRLRASSPCIDAGSNQAAVDASLTVDLGGFDRFYDLPGAPNASGVPGVAVDIGVWEFGDCDGNLQPDLDELAQDPARDCNDNQIIDTCLALELDCDADGRPDLCAIEDGATDCNGDGIPDECDRDCNDNGVPDGCDIADEVSSDCNRNGVPDECELLGAGADDLPPGGDGILDECQADCDGNRRADGAEIADGSATDCDGDGVLDRCQRTAVFGSPNLLESPDVDGVDERDLDLATDGEGTWVAVWHRATSIARDDEQQWVAMSSYSHDDGDTWSQPQPIGVETSDVSSVSAVVTSTSRGVFVVAWVRKRAPFNSGEPASVIVGRSEDGGVSWNGWLELASEDMNRWFPRMDTDGLGNVVLVWSAASGNYESVWFSHSPDEGLSWSEPDLIVGSRQRDVAIASGSDGVWMSAQQRFTSTGDSWDITLARSIDSGLTWQSMPFPAGEGFGVAVDPGIATDGYGNWVVVWRSDLQTGTRNDPEILRSISSDDGLTWSPAEVLSPEFALEETTDSYPRIWTNKFGLWVCAWTRAGILMYSSSSTNGLSWTDPKPLSATPVYAVELASSGESNWRAGWVTYDRFGGQADSDLDVALARVEVPEDCNRNGEYDACDLLMGEESDCTASGILDACEAPADCNGNGVNDYCDTFAGDEPDCTNNGIPDVCEPDCDANGIADSCDIAAGAASDCNEDGVPDQCDIALGRSVDEYPIGGDAVPDDCQGMIHAPGPRWPTLFAALDAVPAGGVVLVTPGYYSGPGNRDLVIDRPNVSFRCAGAHGTCIIDAGGAARGLTIASSTGTNTLVEGFSFENCRTREDGAGLLIESGGSRIVGCTFRLNRSEWNANSGTSGAAVSIYTESAGTHLFSDCVFQGNVATSRAGALSAYAPAGSLVFRRCNFRNNTATEAGGFWSLARHVAVEDTVFSNNTASRPIGSPYGGGFRTIGDVSIERCIFIGNRASSGAACRLEDGAVFIDRTYFVGNEGSRDSGTGAIDATRTNLEIRNSFFGGNIGGFGSALYRSSSGSATLTGVTAIGNGVPEVPDGCLFRGSVSLTNSILWDNICSGVVEADYSIVEGGATGEGNISEAPVFVDDDCDPFRLAPDSPGVNAADPEFVGLDGEFDASGLPRVLCGRIDMGAFESQFATEACMPFEVGEAFPVFLSCYSGPDLEPSVSTSCLDFDVDGDRDVDLRDFAAWSNPERAPMIPTALLGTGCISDPETSRLERTR